MKILNGETSLVQWDKNMRVTDESFNVGDKFHVYNGTTEKAPVMVAYSYEGNVVIDIPNEFLMTHLPITVYEYREDGDCGHTCGKCIFPVEKRPKPDDYVYEQTEVLTIESVVEAALLEAKESGEFDGSDGLTPYIGENGNWWIGETDTRTKAEGADGEDADVSQLVPRMSIMDEMMFEKFGTGEKDYFFSQANWDDLQRYNRVYVQAYDDENDLRLGDDGKGLYALRAICRFGAGTVPHYPWIKKSDWVAKYRENNPQTELTDAEIITNHPPKDADFGDMATLIERQPNGFIKVPTGFPTDKTEAQMEGYTVPKKYADSIKNIALAAVPRVACPDRNRYAYTTSLNSKGESMISLIKMGANPTPDVNQPLIRRRVNGAVGTLKNPQADDDAASKYYVDILGDAILTGLDSIITAQNELLGG